MRHELLIHDQTQSIRKADHPIVAEADLIGDLDGAGRRHREVVDQRSDHREQDDGIKREVPLDATPGRIDTRE
ncbi:MAG TPA: hypothetical protein VF722_01435 [Gemmatimonadaceae bacterium]